VQGLILILRAEEPYMLKDIIRCVIAALNTGKYVTARLNAVITITATTEAAVRNGTVTAVDMKNMAVGIEATAAVMKSMAVVTVAAMGTDIKFI